MWINNTNGLTIGSPRHKAGDFLSWLDPGPDMVNPCESHGYCCANIRLPARLALPCGLRNHYTCHGAVTLEGGNDNVQSPLRFWFTSVPEESFNRKLS
jgi:hypothetical protein